LVILFELLQNIMRGNSNVGYTSTKFLPDIYSFDFISELISENKETLLDFKLSQYCECILSPGWFPRVWIFCADVSKHCLFHLQMSLKQE